MIIGPYDSQQMLIRFFQAFDVLSLCAIALFSLAPIGSIYLLFFFPPSSSSATGIISDGASLLSQLLPLLERLSLQQQQHFDSPSSSSTTTAASASSIVMDSASSTLQDMESLEKVKLVLPWIVSFVLGVVLPAAISVLSVLQIRQEDAFGDDIGGFGAIGTSILDQPSEKQLLYVQSQLIYYSKKLQECDQVQDHTNTISNYTDNNEEGNSDHHFDSQGVVWSVPCPGRLLPPTHRTSWGSSSSSSCGGGSINSSSSSLACRNDSTYCTTTRTATAVATRPVVGCCVICLGPYEVNDTIAWSSNPACVHCFHLECIAEWLQRRSQHSQQHKQCPCCRQAFIL